MKFRITVRPDLKQLELDGKIISGGDSAEVNITMAAAAALLAETPSPLSSIEASSTDRIDPKAGDWKAWTAPAPVVDHGAPHVTAPAKSKADSERPPARHR